MRDTVFLGYSQDELDRAYDQRVWAANAEVVMARYRAMGAAVRTSTTGLVQAAYGADADETLDIFPAARRAPIHVHIHGGAWRAQTKLDASFAASAIVAAGMHYVVPDFTNLPAVRMPHIVGQLIRAFAWTHRNAESFGGDPDRLLLSGHSSGAHLAAVLLTVDWREHGLPPDLIKAALLSSGIYDLGPVMLSSRRAYIDLEDDEIARFSPLRHVAVIRCPAKVMYGEAESPEFVRQAKTFAGALSAAGLDAELITVPKVNHFEMNEEFGRAGSSVFKAAVAQFATIAAGESPVRPPAVRAC